MRTSRGVDRDQPDGKPVLPVSNRLSSSSYKGCRDQEMVGVTIFAIIRRMRRWLENPTPMRCACRWGRICYVSRPIS